jgi:hypothetical protein
MRLGVQNKMRLIPRPRWIAVWLSVIAALSGQVALAADTGNGSKNFRVPGSVPNYFSNEAGPMIGGAAESRRGELYGGAAPSAAPAPQPRSHVAIAVPQRVQRFEVARGRSRVSSDRRGGGHRQVAHARSTSHVAVRATSRVGASHPAAKTTIVGSNHHRGRG